MKKTVGWLKLLSLGLVISLILSQMALVRADVVEIQTPTETTVTAENSEPTETEKTPEATTTSVADTEANAKQSALLFETQSLELSSDNSDQEDLNNDLIGENDSNELQSDVTTSSQVSELQNTNQTDENLEVKSDGSSAPESKTTSSTTSNENESNESESTLPSDSSQSDKENINDKGETRATTSSNAGQEIVEDDAGKKAAAEAEKLAQEEADKKAQKEAEKKAKEEAGKKAKEEADKKAAEEEAAKQAELALYEYTPMGLMPSNGYPVDQDSLILATQFNGTSTNGQSTFDSVGQLWTYNGMVYVSVLTNMGTSTLYLGPGNALPQVSKDELGALEPLLIDHDNNPATAAISYPVGGTSGSTKKEHWSVFRYNLSDFLGLMQANPSNSFLLTLIVGQGHWIAGYFTVVLPVVTANLTKTWLGGPMTPVTLNLYRKIEGGTEQLYDTVTLSATNGTATHQWTNLAYTNLAGQRWIYRIDEADPGQGYDADFSSTYDAATRTYTFTLANTYILTPKQFVIRGRKTIDTRPIASGETFTMQLYTSDANGTQGAMISSATTQGDGSFAFPAITYQVAGTFYYLVKEVPGSKPGMTYDVTPKLVAVNVVDNNDGTLSISMNPTIGASVENKYQAQPVTVSFAFEKELSGRSLLGGEFSFSIYRSLDGSGATVGDALQTVTNSADGSVRFNLTYTDGQEGLYHYTIKENLSDPANGVTHLTTLLVYTVNIYDDNNGHLQYTLYPPSDPTFYNAYKAADTSLTLRATKLLNGRALKAGEFQFELLDDQGTVIRTATNDASGNIVFSPAISYSDKDLTSGNNLDTYTYTVREVEPDPKLGGISYDKGIKTLTVNVQDNGDGSMTASVAGTAVFTNVYTTAPLSVPLPVTKTLTGRTATTVRDRFTFTLDGANEQSLDFYGNGTKNFYYYLNYTLADLGGAVSKVFDYIVAELDGGIDGITYDSKLQRNISIIVRDMMDGTLSAEIVDGMDNTQAYDTAFSNEYEAEPVSVPLGISKTLSGRTGTFSDTFQFRLSPIPEVAGQDVISTDAELNFTENGSKIHSFEALQFSLADLGGESSKTFKYKLEEIIPDTPIPGMVYDAQAVREISITVTDNGLGQLLANVDLGENPNEGNNIHFSNTYKASPVSITLKGKKQLLGRTGTFSDAYTFSLDDLQTKALFFTENNTQSFSFNPLTYTLDELGPSGSKVFTYKVTEEGFPSIPGMVYDVNAIQTINVTVTDNGDGTLSAEADHEASYVNEYMAEPVDLIISGSKTLMGRSGEFSDTFLFSLNGEQTQELNFQANGSKDFAFAPITYMLEDLGGASEKTFEYSVAELVPPTLDAIPGITYDANPVRKVLVTLKDNGNGTLSAQADIKPSFTNLYGTGTAAATIQLKKVLSGRTGSFRDVFRFTLDGQYERELVFTANGEQTLNFPPLQYKLADLEGAASKTFTYKVAEINDAIPGMIYDSQAEQTVSVTVTDDGEGNLVAVVNELPVFENRYETKPAELILSGKKTLSGLNSSFSDTFSFSLDGKDVQEVVFTENGTKDFSFSPISYTFADLEGQNSKSFVFYIKEEVGAPIPGIVYDTELTRPITVILADKGDGTMGFVVSETPNFTNSYVLEESTWTPMANKRLFGLKALEGGDYRFEVNRIGEVEPVSRGINDANGVISFSPITITAADIGESIYEIREIIGTDPNTSYDESVYEVILNVSDNGDGTLAIVPTYPEGGIHFFNLYESVVTHDPPVEKKVTGAGAPTDAVFRFKMEAITPYAPMPEGAEDGEMIREITGAGSFEFGIMSYVAPGTYVYELRELPTTAEHFSTDPTLYTITVHISSDNGLLKKDVVYTMNNGTEPVEALVFNNKYEAPPIPTTTTTPSTSKAKPNPIPRTGEAGTQLSLYALVLMATAALLFIARKRRKNGVEEQELSDHAK